MTRNAKSRQVAGGGQGIEGLQWFEVCGYAVHVVAVAAPVQDMLVRDGSGSPSAAVRRRIAAPGRLIGRYRKHEQSG